MGAAVMSGPNGEKIESAEQMCGLFLAEVMERVPGWRQSLTESPDRLAALEQEVRAQFARGADMLIAGVVAVVLASASLAQASEETRRQFAHPLAKGRNRTIRVRLMSGFIMWITSLYCEPKKGFFRKADESIPGLHVELAQFGFGKGITPGLEDRVARQSALCPSFQTARRELARDGLPLDIKLVRRIAYDCGEDLLKLRKWQLMRWRDGKLPAGNELHGKRVTVQIDGGRTKIRSKLRKAIHESEPQDENGLCVNDAPGRSKKKSKRTYDADWREPKLITIFVHNDEGRMDEVYEATIDGTFLGPDATAELVAMHLHRLGAAKAASITFAADGAPWIWDRIDGIVAKAKISKEVSIHQVLDNCHASHHISIALAGLGYSERERIPYYREYRTKLRNGQWQQVVDELDDVVTDRSNEESRTAIEYLRKHGEAGRLSYPYFRQLGIPLGSGAIESSIRRVINLRMKNNGTTWREENAENMLQLRAHVISNRWDSRMQEVRQMRRERAEKDWRWEPQTMRCKVEPENVNTT
jgi:hypothetical protein